MTYYNTNQLGTAEVKQYSKICASQDEAVRLIFLDYKRPMTPSEVWRVYTYPNLMSSTPLTSIRRSITNLTKQGFLEKTEDKKEGIFGRPENVWVIYVNKDKQTKLF